MLARILALCGLNVRACVGQNVGSACWPERLVHVLA